MDVSELRKRILRALDDARKAAVDRRAGVDEAARAYETFLSEIAVPMLRQSATVLRASGHLFTVNTPAESVRLVSDALPQTFLEFVLDVTPDPPNVIGRVSVARGRQGMIVDERPIADGKRISEITEDDVAKFLVAEIPKLVVRS